MSINQPPASVAVPQIAPPEAQKAPNRRAAEPTPMQRVRVGFAKVEAAIGLSGLAIVASGVVVAVGGTALAIQEGVPYPLAAMVGYCTMAVGACLGAAFVNIRKRAPAAKAASPLSAHSEPNYAAWKLVSKFRISDASRLWCDIEPGSPASQESIAWGTAMLDAVKRGELPTAAKTGGQATSAQEQRNPGWSTEIGRDDLMAWAKAHGQSPRFLQK